MNVPLLERLRSAGGEFVSWAALHEREAALGRDLAKLEQFGFLLECHPVRGVAYRGPAARLCPDQIEHALATRRIGRRIAVWNRVSSTNDLALRASGSTANEGLVVLAEEQTRGRGRWGRAWSAPACSSLLVSVLMFPPSPLDDPTWLTALGAVAAAEVIEAWTGRKTGIKWPNDVRVDGMKVGGILVERGEGAVIGIGLNVNVAADDLPADLRETATSVRILSGERADRSAMARELIIRLDRLYDEGIVRGSRPLDVAWSPRLEALGQHVRIETTADAIEGRLVEAGLGGGFIVEQAGGTKRTVPTGRIRGLSVTAAMSPRQRAGVDGGQQPNAPDGVFRLERDGEDC